MRFAQLTTLVVLSALATGCTDHFYYELELTPNGDQMNRRLTCWKQEEKDGQPKVAEYPRDELAQIVAAYGADMPSKLDSKHTFETSFTGRTPEDLGGAGSYEGWHTLLGDSFWYVERFRGHDDLVAQLDERNRAADRLADLLRGWLVAELGNDPQYAGAIKFVDVEFRHDLKNFGAYMWMATAAPDSFGPADDQDPSGSALVATLQYFVERDYFSPRDLPQILYGADESAGLELLASVLLRKSGLADRGAGDARLAFLRDEQACRESWKRYARTLPEYQAALAAWETEKATDPDAQPPDPSAPVEEALATLFFDLQLFGRIDNFKLTLHTPVKPHLTNGVWDDEQKAVIWDVFLGADNELPTLCHAWWSTPNVDAQMRHFGQVLLDEDQLSEYAYWYTSLSDEERGEWDAFLGGLSPGPDLSTRLEQFRFRAESKLPPDEQGGTHRARGRELMLQQIEYRAKQAAAAEQEK